MRSRRTLAYSSALQARCQDEITYFLEQGQGMYSMGNSLKERHISLALTIYTAAVTIISKHTGAWGRLTMEILEGLNAEQLDRKSVV